MELSVIVARSSGYIMLAYTVDVMNRRQKLLLPNDLAKETRGGWREEMLWERERDAEAQNKRKKRTVAMRTRGETGSGTWWISQQETEPNNRILQTHGSTRTRMPWLLAVISTLSVSSFLWYAAPQLYPLLGLPGRRRDEAGRAERNDVGFGAYDSRTFGLRMAVAMSMTTFTTTTMIVK